MDTEDRAGRYLGITAICGLALVIGWLTGAIGPALAFTAGATAATALLLFARVAAPAVRLSAATSEPAVGWAEFHRELSRARRYERAFGIVRFVGVAGRPGGERVIRDRVAALSRRIDRVWLDGNDLFVLLPESDAAAVQTAIERARYRLGEMLDAPVTAIFPANGITSGSLIACLYQGDASPVAIGALAPAPPIAASLAAPDEGDLAESAT
jgi:hypothetical protein